MPNWCSNTLEIQFPNKEAKDSFKAALEDTSCRQGNTVRKAVHILVLSMLGRYQPNRPIHGLETSEHLRKEGIESVFSAPVGEVTPKTTAFTQFAKLLIGNPLITEETSESIDTIYEALEADKATFDSFTEPEKGLLEKIRAAIGYDHFGGMFSENQSTEDWYKNFLTEQNRDAGAILDFQQFVELHLTDSVSGFNSSIFKGFGSYGDHIDRFGTKWNSFEKWEDIVHDETDVSVTFSFDTAWSPATPVFHAIFEKYKADGSYISYEEGCAFAVKEDFEEGKCYATYQDDIIYECIDEDDEDSDVTIISPDFLVEHLYG